MSQGHSRFDTPLGTCAIAWSDAGVTGFALPDDSRLAAMARHASPAEPPAYVVAAIAGVRALLAGEPVRFETTPLDLADATPFERAVYAAAQTLAPGKTTTYGAMAAALGQPGAARAVGAALGANPIPVIVPCHRILAANGRPGGFSAAGGVATKMALLDIEGAFAAATLPLFAATRDGP